MSRSEDGELDAAVEACRAAVDQVSELRAFRLKVLLRMLQSEIDREQHSFLLKTLFQMLRNEIEKKQQSHPLEQDKAREK